MGIKDSALKISGSVLKKMVEKEPLTFYLYSGEGVLDGMGRRKGEKRYV